MFQAKVDRSEKVAALKRLSQIGWSHMLEESSD